MGFVYSAENMRLIKRTAIIFIVMLSCVGCDQATKMVARRNLPKSESISILNNTLRFQYMENSGGFLSLGANIPEAMRSWVFILLVGVFLCAILSYLLMKRHLTNNQIIALSLVAGGGIGNLIDRIFNECRVVDFMSLGVGSLRTGIFNVADIAITFGVVWFLFTSIKSGGRETNSL